MSLNLLVLSVILSPVAFFITSLVSRFHPGNSMLVKQLSKFATNFGLIIAAICGILVVKYGHLQTDLLGYNNLGFSLRLDALSVIMLSMIALLSFIISKFSINYLDGDKRQGVFMGRLSATIASVQLLVLSGNLLILLVSWILTSICLHRLLVFYSNRPGAIIAAKKKFILARLGDVSLLIAAVSLYKQFGSGDLEFIFSSIKNYKSLGVSMLGLETAAIFLALAAILKSAQFPTHGWIIEVMETPTPVSALLHAGLLNAGPFLIIRMAFVMESSFYAPIILMVVGGFTALFASVVYLTQTSIKTALSYSSIAHMGFSLMVCGFGVYPAAMLHLVAHSFYKAHAFLSSGSVIDTLRANKVAPLARLGSPIRILLGITMAITVYVGFAWIWGLNLNEDLSILIIGAIIVMGLSRLFISALDTKGGFALLIQASLLAILVTASFFTLEAGTHFLLSEQLPEHTGPLFAKGIIMGMILVAFGLTVFIQIIAPVWSQKLAYQKFAIHIKNGFYANALFDKLIDALRVHSPETKQVLKRQLEQLKNIKYNDLNRVENKELEVSNY